MNHIIQKPKPPPSTSDFPEAREFPASRPCAEGWQCWLASKTATEVHGARSVVSGNVSVQAPMHMYVHPCMLAVLQPQVQEGNLQVAVSCMRSCISIQVLKPNESNMKCHSPPLSHLEELAGVGAEVADLTWAVGFRASDWPPQRLCICILPCLSLSLSVSVAPLQRG